MPAIRKDTLTVVAIGLGSALFSFGAMALYREPPPKEVRIELTARASTEPRELLARRAAAAPPSVAAETSPVETAAAAPAPSREAAPVATAVPVPAAPAPAPVSTPPVVAAAAPQQASSYRVRISHVTIGGARREVHDFTSGVAYTGPVENFAVLGSPAPVENFTGVGEPVWVRRAQGKPVAVSVEDFTSPGVPAWVRRVEKGSARP